MKQILLGLVFLATTCLNAKQTTVFSDDFNDKDVSNWTIINAYGDTASWGDITWKTHQFWMIHFSR